MMNTTKLRRLTAFILMWLAACGGEAASTREQPEVDADAAAEALPAGWDEQLSLSTLPDENDDERVVEVTLEARVADVNLKGKPVEMWTYGGTLPGPVIRAQVGDTLRVHFTNHLPEATTVHFHGLELPAAMDGSEAVQKPIEPGASFDYEFRLTHAGTYWYHPHLNSAAQVWRGLYGALIVEDPKEPALGAEAVLMLDDVMLDADGALSSPEENGALGDFFGREGDTMLVNGRVLPTLYARDGDALRLRIVNTATSRYFKVAMDGQKLVRVAGDSGLLEHPEQLDSVLLAPGERAEVVVIASGAPGAAKSLRMLPYDRFVCGGGCGIEAELAHIEIVEGEGFAPELPDHFATIAPIDVSDATEQTIEFTKTNVGGDDVLGFNDHVAPYDELTIMATVGDTQVWTLTNLTDYDHPFHLHGFRFQVLEQNEVAPAQHEWKDTINVPANGSAKIALTFDDRPGMWMFHCHILDHAKIGMMGMLHLME